MSMNNLIEYGDNYSKKSGSLWQYYRDKPALTLTMQKTICVTSDNGTKMLK